MTAAQVRPRLGLAIAAAAIVLVLSGAAAAYFTRTTVSVITPGAAVIDPHGAYTYDGCPIYVPGDWFTTNLITGASAYVSNAVDPNSAAIISNLMKAYPTGRFAYAETSEAVNLVSGSPPLAKIEGLKWGFANDPYNDDPSPYTIPISQPFFQEGEVWNNADGASTNTCKGDCHVIVLNTTTCVTWETYTSGSVSWDGSRYRSDAGFVHNLRHPFNDQYALDSYHGTTAADLPMFGNEDFGEEASLPYIPHSVAMFLGLQDKAAGGHVAPATGGMSCKSYCEAPLPYGARLRLHSAFACPDRAAYPQAHLICVQMKTYGVIFDDTTAIDNYFGIRLGKSADGSNPWRESDYMQLLAKLKLSDFDVMTLGTLH